VLEHPSDWFRSQEGLAIADVSGEAASKNDALRVEVGGLVGTLYLSKKDHLPERLELMVESSQSTRSVFEARVLSLSFLDLLPISSFLFEVPSDAVEDAAEGEGLEHKLLQGESVAPEFRATDLQGQEYVLGKASEKPRVLVFWFFKSKESIAQLEGLVPTIKNRAELIAIHCGDSSEEVKACAAKLAPGAVWLQEEPRSLKRPSLRYNVCAYPTTYVLAPDGKILERFAGRNRDKVNEALRRSAQ
jgi:hypothetical protein